MHAAQIPVGHVVSVEVRVYGRRVRHVGLRSDLNDARTGLPVMLHCSKRLGAAHETTWQEFTTGSTGAPILNVGNYGSTLDPRIVVARARARLGWKWDLTNHNCEMYVRHALGLPEISPQLREGVTHGAVVATFVAVLLAASGKK